MQQTAEVAAGYGSDAALSVQQQQQQPSNPVQLAVTVSDPRARRRAAECAETGKLSADLLHYRRQSDRQVDTGMPPLWWTSIPKSQLNLWIMGVEQISRHIGWGVTRPLMDFGYNS